MFRKTAVIMAAIMTLSILVPGCGINKKASITMDLSDEKKAVLEFSNAREDDSVLGGFIQIEEGECVELVSDLNDTGKVTIGFIPVEENQTADKLPDMENITCEMSIIGPGTESSTITPGEYDLNVTVQNKAAGTVTLSVKSVTSIPGYQDAPDSTDVS